MDDAEAIVLIGLPCRQSEEPQLRTALSASILELSTMHRIVAALVGLLTAFAAGFALFYLIGELIYGDVNRAPPGFIKVTISCLTVWCFGGAATAYRYPDSVALALRRSWLWFYGTAGPEKLVLPIQRLSFVVLVAGVVIVVMTMFLYYVTGHESYFRYVALRRARGLEEDAYALPLYIGAFMVVVGLLGSHLYAKTVGQLIAWVRRG